MGAFIGGPATARLGRYPEGYANVGYQRVAKLRFQHALHGPNGNGNERQHSHSDGDLCEEPAKYESQGRWHRDPRFTFPPERQSRTHRTLKCSRECRGA